MANWIANTFSRTIDLLTRQGRADLASDLKRVAEVIDIQDINALMLPDAEKIIESLTDIQTMQELGDQLTAVAKAFDLKYCSMVVIEETSGHTYPVRLLTNYPTEWIDYYISNNCSTYDPIVTESLKSYTSFFWKSPELLENKEKTFMDKAQSYGIGYSGYTSIVKLENGDKIGVSGCADQSYAAFNERFFRTKEDFEEVSYYLSEAFSIISGNSQRSEQLTPDQLRLLRAISIGSTFEELATIEFAFGSLETVEKSVLEVFEARTLAEAAVRAAQNGILSSTPLMRNEIFSTAASVEHYQQPNVTPICKQYRGKRAIQS